MIDRLEYDDDHGALIRDIMHKVNEVVGAWNRHEHERVTAAATELLVKMSTMSVGLPLAVVHPLPDGEAVITRLVANGQAQIMDDELVLTDDGRAQGQAILDGLRVP